MHRFPNAISDLNSLKTAFKFLHENIKTDLIFDLMDMRNILVTTGIISSSGSIGAEALERGSNKDLSRDKPYNQSKMYAEAFRALGWIQSTKDKALQYSFTLMGDNLIASNFNKSLIENCFIGMEFPNDKIDVKGKGRLKPFLGILKLMKGLNGVLSRNELIFYLFVEDDSKKKNMDKTISQLLNHRGKSGSLDEALDSLCKKRNISRKPTAENYTRYPLGILKGLNWANPTSDKENYIGNERTYKMTERAKKILEICEQKLDLRMDVIKSKNIQREASISSYYSMLEESGIDISQHSKLKKENDELLLKEIGTTDVIFSPFQVLDVDTLSDIFKTPIKIKRTDSDNLSPRETRGNLSNYSHLDLSLSKPSTSAYKNELNNKIKNLLNQYSKKEVIQKLKETFKNYDKTEFYPLIEDIFKCMGINCYLPPHGDNSQRFDALLLGEDDAIPVEIKSPREELKVGVKAVRQALENKVILRARFREIIPNKSETSTLVVGWEVPNLRSQDFELIKDIYKAYDIKIAIIGINSLLKTCIDAVENGQSAEFKDFAKMKQGIYK